MQRRSRETEFVACLEQSETKENDDAGYRPFRHMHVLNSADTGSAIRRRSPLHRSRLPRATSRRVRQLGEPFGWPQCRHTSCWLFYPMA